LLSVLRRVRDRQTSYAPHLDTLYAYLHRNPGVPVDRVPGDVITMHSRFAITPRASDGLMFQTLVYAEETAPHLGRISVLSPLGSALLGARVGEQVRWPSLRGEEITTVRKILYQPEAAGELSAT
jgi:regulator of nucleoside diphosphate kinase